MFKHVKRFLCIVVALLLLSSFSGDILAQMPTKAPLDLLVVNPLYADVVAQNASLAANYAARVATTETEGSQYGEAFYQAVADLRRGMTQRQEAITVYFPVPEYSFTLELYMDVFYASMEHTGVANEGDYLQWTWGRFNGNVEYIETDDGWSFAITYYLTYYNDAQQEAAVAEQAALLLEELALDGKTDYEKLCAIYDWICENVVYDYDHLNDGDYKLKYTAYGALVDKTAVCQGYAVLLYRLLLEVGLDCRVVVGYGNGGRHAWNIVELDGLYYNVDSTWDATYAQYGLDYPYFLRCNETFGNHYRDSEYLTDEFNAAYPMGETDYVPPAQEEIVKGDADCNGQVDAEDLTLLARHLAGIAQLEDDAALSNMDVNGDEQVDAEDLTDLARYLAGIISDWEDAAA